MESVVVNPRKFTHEEVWQQENVKRTRRFAEIKEAVCDCSKQEGMQKLGFTDKTYYQQFKAAFYLAQLAHKNQVDKAGMDYICHPATVALHVRDTYPASKKRDRAMIVALLHDVLEDTSVTTDALKSFGFDEKIIHTVELLSREPGESYDVYLEKLQVSKAAIPYESSCRKRYAPQRLLPEPSSGAGKPSAGEKASQRKKDRGNGRTAEYANSIKDNIKKPPFGFSCERWLFNFLHPLDYTSFY